MLFRSCSIMTKGNSAIVTANSTVRDDGRTGYTMKFFYGNPEKPLLTVTGSYGRGGAPVSVYEGDGITVTPIENLMNDETGKATTPVKMMLGANIMTALLTLTKNLPEDTSLWLTEQIRNMMTPSRTKTSPTSTPVVDGE